MKKNLLQLAALMIFSSVLRAEEEVPGPEMADALRSSGKIYIVVAVLAVIFSGLFIYLFLLGRKIGRLEKKTGTSSGNR